eukprot:CAMPEP_0184491068 /NCGR_PEP_ID=MMETSP0113_2-20130426/19537_1 /TAXON_ID=91329 /ORGANISM="Norrisiella sphaerica, Strain BC52" /LENGTH=665 /DNA_ID=CAMNT_0026875263 /DNA_START=109 /DNA_END=2106 /DNA_ORIENTATION=-
MVLKTVTTFLTTVPTRPTRTYEFKNVLINVCIFILVMEMCERLCFYGLTGSIKVLFQSRFGYTSFQASALTNVLPSFVYLTPLLGGYVADEYWGRFKTIAVFGIVYLAGVSIMSYSVYPGRENKDLFLMACFGLLALGSGGIKANVVTLGGDQFDDKNPVHVQQKEAFFNYFYWAINIGAGVSYGYLAQMATNGSGDISPEYGFFWSFTICSIALGMALVVFLGASSRYIMYPASGGTMGIFFQVFKDSLRTSWEPWGIALGLVLMITGFVLSVSGAFVQDDATNKNLAIAGCANAGAGVLLTGAMCVDTSWVGAGKGYERVSEELDEKSPDILSSNENGSIDGSNGENTSKSNLEAAGSHERQVENSHDIANAKELWRVMPPVLCATSFWVAYGQMSGNFYAQSCQMDLRVGSSQLNAAVLNVGDCIAIVVCIPLFDTFLYPLIERVKGSKFTLLQKMASGFVVSTLALLAAAFIEIKRRDSGVPDFMSPGASYSNCAPVYSDSNPDTCAQDDSGFLGKKTCMSNMSVFWMAIPYFLIGVSECLISVQVYELCYTEIPVEMRSSAQAINLFTTGLASAIAAGLTVAFQVDIPNDLNKGHLERVYFTIAAIQFLTFLIFIYVTRNFEYKKVATNGFQPLAGDSESKEAIDQSFFEKPRDIGEAEA